MLNYQRVCDIHGSQNSSGATSNMMLRKLHPQSLLPYPSIFASQRRAPAPFPSVDIPLSSASPSTRRAKRPEPRPKTTRANDDVWLAKM